MTLLKSALVGSLATVAAAIAGGLGYVAVTGLQASSQPSGFEVTVARAVRRFAVPGVVARRTNPTPASPEGLDEGLAHYADHCASCHGLDGSGETEMGRGLFPKAPDMRAAATQQMSDGELFYVIEHGVRFTGMPAWSTGTAAGERASWQLVHVVRHLPRLTAEEKARMETQMPRSSDAIRQEIEEEEFLNGGGEPPPATHSH